MENNEVVIAPHLTIAVAAVNRLGRGFSTNQVLVAGLAELERFVRTNPDDAPFIDAGPLEPYPVTKFVVNQLEKMASDTRGQVSYGVAAIRGLGPIVAAVKSLEVQLQQLGSRVAQLEQR